VRRAWIATLFAGLLIGVDAANAATVNGTPRADRLRGTSGADVLYGRGGSDRITAGPGPDFIHGGPGRDVVLAGPGDDRIALQVDRARDSVNCGRGYDIVNAERTDLVAADCEVVARQLSRDPYRTGLAQHETQVEPDSMSAGRTIVTAFQTGRFTGGGAANIGWSTSRDGGQTWTSGFLPGTTIFSSLGGTLDIVTDPVVAYDAAHRTWLIASLGVSPAGAVLLVSRSADGRTWSLPVRAVVGAPVEELDKEWLTCDNWSSSPFRGRCYLSYLSFGTGQLRTIRSNDGGLSWSTPVVMYGRVPGHLPNGVQPGARPDGSVVVSFEVFTLNPGGNHIGAVRSVDGGQTWGPTSRVASVEESQVTGMRAGPLPSMDVDARGNVYVAWSDCHFSDLCAADVALAVSRDGVSWSAPTRVPIDTVEAAVHRFVPGLAVDPATGRLAVTYHTMKLVEACDPERTCPGVDVGLITSADGGNTWSRTQRLTAETMPLSWIAEASFGRMLGDYISTSWVAGRPVPVFSLASSPVNGEFRQAVFAATRIR
jgi:hypothetical protein